MKKTDVYVVVDTPKKAKKLKKVLDMFGEEFSSTDGNAIKTGSYNGSAKLYTKFNKAYFAGCNWTLMPTCNERLEVSIKELRNILAKEHLKEGDVVLTKDGNDKIIAVVNKTCNSNVALFESKRWIRLHDGFKLDNKGCFLDFIRYATEEEKALLEPKKELEVWKWYKGTCDFESLIFITEIENTGSYNHIHGYGFKWGQWNDLSHLLSNTDHEKSLVEANFEEVKQELIKEAKRLGHNYDKYSYDPDENNLFGYNGRLEEVFVDGVWNEPYDKLSNLKEAFNNGYCVDFYDVKTDTWKRHENPCWNPDLKWRIMVNNGHLVVSDVYLLNKIKELKKSIEEIKSNIK